MDKHSTRKLIQYELRDVKNSKRVFFTRHISGLYLAADEKRAGAEYFVWQPDEFTKQPINMHSVRILYH